MKPASIVNFERFYLGSLIVSVLSTIVFWGEGLAAVQAALPPELQFGSAILLASIVIGIAITLLLWFFVVRRSSVVAKWIVVLFFAISLISLVFSMAGGTAMQGRTLRILVSLVGLVLQGLAVWMLFRPDANAWFSKTKTSVFT